jgi:WD40 repeat protein
VVGASPILALGCQRENRRDVPAHYRAFLSYSHSGDERLAAALQYGLQQFAKPYYMLRALDVFRDKTDLGAKPGLWPTIAKALDASEFLIVLASPRAAESRWVKREIDHWLAHHPVAASRLLLALTDGELQWGPAGLEWPPTTALPRVLDWDEGEQAPARTLDGAFAQMPLYVDLRWAREAEDLSLRNPRFLDCVATLAAVLHDREKRDMIGVDVREHRRFRRVRRGVFAALSALLVTTAIAGVVALNERETALAERNVAEARQLAAVAETLLAAPAREFHAALGMAAASVAITPTFEGNQALRRGLSLVTSSQAPVVCGVTARLVAVSDDGAALAAVDKGTLTVCRAGGEVVSSRMVPPDVALVAVDRRGRRVLFARRAGAELLVVVRDVATGDETVAVLPASVEEVVFDGDGALLLARTRRYNCELWSPDGQRIDLPWRPGSHYVWDAAVSPDGRFVATITDPLKPAVVVRTRSGGTIATGDIGGTSLEFSPDGAWLVAATSSEVTVVETATWKSRSLPVAGSSTRPAIVFRADGAAVAVFTGEELRMWEVATLRDLGRARISSPTFVAAVLSNDGERFALLEADGLRIFDVAGFPQASAVELARAPLSGATIAQGLAFMPDGTGLAVPETSVDDARRLTSVTHHALFAAADGAIARRRRLRALGKVGGLALSPSGCCFAVSQSLGDVSVVPATGDGVALFETKLTMGEGSISRAARFGPDERMLAVPFDRLVTVGNEYRLRRGNFELWDLTARTLVARHEGPYDDLAFGTDGRLRALRLLQGRGYRSNVAQIDLFDPAGALERSDIPRRSSQGEKNDEWLKKVGSFRPGGDVLAFGTFFGVPDGEFKNPPAGQDVVWSDPYAFGWSDDGRWLAVAGVQEPVRLWNLSTGEVHKLGDGGTYDMVAFDRSHTVLAADDGAATSVWRLSDASIVARIERRETGAGALAFSPDGRLLWRGEGASLVAHWWRGEDLLAQACRFLRQNVDVAPQIPRRGGFRACPALPLPDGLADQSKGE